MLQNSRTIHRILTAAAAFSAGCASLQGDPLSPPHVRHAACAAEHVAVSMKEKMSPEYQAWWQDVEHFGADTVHEIEDEYHRNNNWPNPYRTLAQHAVRQPIEQQAENARQQLTTLWDYHFESATGKMNPMGRKRLHDIVNQTGSLGHSVFVQRTASPSETRLRIDEVNVELSNMDLGGATFNVTEANSNPSLVSGAEAQRAMKLLTEPKKESSGSLGGSSEAPGSGGGQ